MRGQLAASYLPVMTCQLPVMLGGNSGIWVIVSGIAIK